MCLCFILYACFSMAFTYKHLYSKQENTLSYKQLKKKLFLKLFVIITS